MFWVHFFWRLWYLGTLFLGDIFEQENFVAVFFENGVRVGIDVVAGQTPVVGDENEFGIGGENVLERRSV